MATFDNMTGKLIEGFAEVEQSIRGYLMPVSFGERVLAEHVGSWLPALFLKPFTKTRVALSIWAIATAVDLFEPRFKITQIKTHETPETRRAGNLRYELIGEYMPRGHLGDFTVESERSITL